MVAWFSSHHAWTAAFVTGTVAAIISGVMWFWIDAGRPVSARQAD
jgi:sugar phosphate permease